MSTTITIPKLVVTFAITTSIDTVMDINTFWTTQILAATGKLTAAVGTTDTTIAVDKISGTQQAVANSTSIIYPNRIQGQTATITVGSAILVGSETATVTAITGNDTTGYTLTLSRGQSQTVNGVTTVFPFAAATTHAIGEAVSLLTFPSPWVMGAALWLLPGAQQAKAALGAASASYQYSATGSVTVSS